MLIYSSAVEGQQQWIDGMLRGSFPGLPPASYHQIHSGHTSGMTSFPLLSEKGEDMFDFNPDITCSIDCTFRSSICYGSHFHLV